jgi:hypothetical protein
LFRSVSHLGKNLVVVARETMQPEHVSTQGVQDLLAFGHEEEQGALSGTFWRMLLSLIVFIFSGAGTADARPLTCSASRVERLTHK